MADIVSQKLAEILNVEDEINGSSKQSSSTDVNPLTNQPTYSSSLVTQADVEAFEAIEDGIGLETYSKIILMKVSQKAMQDHDELIEIMAKVDDSKAARMAEVAQGALSNSSDAAKALMNYSVTKQKLEIEKSKLEIKSVTINNLNTDGGALMTGSQKDVMEQIKAMMNNDNSSTADDPPPLIDC